MKRLVSSVILAVLLQPGAFAASGGQGAAGGSKGAASYASAQGQGSLGAGGMVSHSGSGGTMRRHDWHNAPPLAKERKVNQQDCTKPIDWTAGNLKCK